MKRFGFTMIELVFVIVVLGILAAVAIPRLAVTRDDAQIAKGRSDVASIRSAIVTERQSRLLQGQSMYITALDSGAGTLLFDNNGTAANTLLAYGIESGTGNGHWAKTGGTTYTYTVMNTPVTFTYTSATGRFECNRAAAAPEGAYCKKLVD